jgi:hypothetical protein
MRPYDNHIVIVGSARSGTSWFSEMIALQHRYRMLFEPEHEFKTKLGELICDRYLTEAINTFAINSYLKRVFSNRVDCDWIAQISNRKWKRHLWPFIPKKIIIKFVRCNLSAHYMATHFKIPVVFMVRNPYDVLASQQRVKFSWLYDLSWFKDQDELCDLIKTVYGYDLSKEKQLSDFEKLSLRWCIENSVPFLNENPNFEVLKYETVKADIEVYLNFCKKQGFEPLANIHDVFKQPSSKTHSKSEIITGKTTKRELSLEEYTILNTYLDIFKIDLYEREN